MISLRHFLSRRWLLAFLGVAALLFGLAMLHPYPRQSLFGPKIDGVPWCVWEDKIRRSVVPDWEKGWTLRFLDQIGLLKDSRLPDIPELLPVYLHLANDDHIEVRRRALDLDRRVLREEYWRWSEEDEAKILPVMREHLRDDDPICRLIAAEYLWRATRDREMIKVPLTYLEHTDPYIQTGAQITLCYLAEADLAASLEPILKLTESTKLRRGVRETAVQSLRYFGKSALPSLRNALADPSPDIRGAGMFALSRMGEDAKELIPELQALQNDVDSNLRRYVATALNKIDSKRFPVPAKPND
ncbi:MAG: HEAT repeat domain-containing protein [Gemmataceae bacterium]|nr:HEAT repeat domain-containing protein [Gemmataceae bacterium]